MSDDVDSASMSGAVIAAIAAGAFFGLLLIGAALYFLCFKKTDKEELINKAATEYGRDSESSMFSI